MIKFSKIQQYRNVITNVKSFCEYNGREVPTLKFNGSVKIHGTNAGLILYPDGELSIQGRKNVLTLEEDNYNFCEYITRLDLEAVKFFMLNLKVSFNVPENHSFCVYGEWAGKGIHKSVGVNHLEKFLTIFDIKSKDEDGNSTYYELPTLHNKDIIQNMIEESNFGFSETPRFFYVKTFGEHEIEIDFNNPKLAQNKLIEITEAVEKQCPVAKYFGYDGIGEGIVWRSKIKPFDQSQFWFKIKGKKHSVSKVKTIAEVDPEKVASIQRFVEKTVTNARLNQGIEHLNEMNLPLSRKSTGAYLKWIVNDILTEEADVLEVSGIEGREANGKISDVARKWFFAYLDELVGL